MVNLFNNIRNTLKSSINTLKNSASTGFRNVVNVFKNDPIDFMNRVVGIIKDVKDHNYSGVLNEVSSILNSDFSTEGKHYR
jgi:phage-related protein